MEPPHYELCALRHAPSPNLADAALAEDFEKFHKLRRSSSKCIREHHCGSQQGSIHDSVHGSRSSLSGRDTTSAADGGALLPPAGRRSVVVMKHSCSQDGSDRYRAEEEEEEEGNTISMHHHHHFLHGPSGQEHPVHRSLSNDF